MSQPVDTGLFVWRDLMSIEPTVSASFFTSLFGWHAQPRTDDWGDFSILSHAGAEFAGVRQLPQDNVYPSHWISYVRVSDIDAIVARAVELGGSIGLAPVDFNGVSRIAGLFDPQGAWFALVEPGNSDPFPHMTPVDGFIDWNELLTSDPAEAMSYYNQLLGWDFTPVAPGVDYWLASANGVRLAGVMEYASEDARPSWLIYFRTGDITRSAEQVVNLGGVMRSGIIDVPNVGRTAWASDPTGCHFALMQPIGYSE